ncbi:serine/threonine protein kinase, partial [Streptomyces sp. SID4982]|nr:serine/threonine protein kinase [Streptomyces sp. SID4982]
GTRPGPAPRGTGNRSAPRSGAGRPAQRTTGTKLRPANPRLLRQRLTVFVVVTLLVALGIAVAQGCTGPARGLGGSDGERHTSVQQVPVPQDGGSPLPQQYDPTPRPTPRGQ